MKKAKEEAERRWIEKEGTDLGSDDKIRKVLEDKWKNGEAHWWDGRGWHWSVPSWEQVLDALVEGVIE